MTTPLPVVSESVAVKAGTAPLVYLVEAGGHFRVHDQTTGVDVASGSVPGRGIVRVDGRTGVVFAGETLVPGPLEADHRYVIYRDPTGPNVARQGVFQLTPRQGRGGAQPASQSQSGGLEQQGGPDVQQ